MFLGVLITRHAGSRLGLAQALLGLGNEPRALGTQKDVGVFASGIPFLLGLKGKHKPRFWSALIQRQTHIQASNLRAGDKLRLLETGCGIHLS